MKFDAVYKMETTFICKPMNYAILAEYPKQMKSFLFALLACGALHAQTLDTFFNPGHNGPYREYVGDQFAVMDDGKILSVRLAGGAQEIVRLNLDGSIDETFAPVPNSGGQVIKGPNGRFLTFRSDSGQIAISCYHSDGTPDISFASPMLNGGGTIRDMIWQADGKLVIVGQFTSVNGFLTKNIARLNPNGSVDFSFETTGSGADQAIYTVAQQADGKYIIAGAFYYYSGEQRYLHDKAFGRRN